MAKDNNDYGIDYSTPGICSGCHVEIAEFNGSVEVRPGVYRLRIAALKPTFRTQQVKLSDGSYMNISLCERCFNVLPGDCAGIMASEIKGWNRDAKDFGVSDTAWLEKAQNLTIVDAPYMKWSDDQKNSLKENADGNGQ